MLETYSCALNAMMKLLLFFGSILVTALLLITNCRVPTLCMVVDFEGFAKIFNDYMA